MGKTSDCFYELTGQFGHSWKNPGIRWIILVWALSLATDPRCPFESHRTTFSNQSVWISTQKRSFYWCNLNKIVIVRKDVTWDLHFRSWGWKYCWNQPAVCDVTADKAVNDVRIEAGICFGIWFDLLLTRTGPHLITSQIAPFQSPVFEVYQISSELKVGFENWQWEMDFTVTGSLMAKAPSHYFITFSLLLLGVLPTWFACRTERVDRDDSRYPLLRLLVFLCVGYNWY